MSPSCASDCPTCQEPLPNDAGYGPCVPCRQAMRARATERAAVRELVFLWARWLKPKPPEPPPSEPATRTEPDYEAQARAKQSRLPACALCGGPLWLDQPGAHHVCAPGRHSAPGRALAATAGGAA